MVFGIQKCPAQDTAVENEKRFPRNAISRDWHINRLDVLTGVRQQYLCANKISFSFFVRKTLSFSPSVIVFSTTSIFFSVLKQNQIINTYCISENLIKKKKTFFRVQFIFSNKNIQSSCKRVKFETFVGKKIFFSSLSFFSHIYAYSYYYKLLVTLSDTELNYHFRNVNQIYFAVSYELA